jgi:UDP-N-acetylmuramoylalanine--D-glutamate ligase
MDIAILGFDRQGRSAYNYWASADNSITICDKKSDISVPEDAATQLGEEYLKNLDRFDLLVRTPGLHPRDIQKANPSKPDIIDKVTTVTNEFMRVCPSKNIIGITGTKGKGTTSTLVANMLEAAGKRVHLGGNIGIAPLDMLQDSIQPDDWVVLELANYQLIDIVHSPAIAVCLMIAPEHLDWHGSLDEYLRAKQQLFLYQSEEDVAIYKATDNRSMQLASSSIGKTVPYMAKPGAIVENDAIVIDQKKVCRVSDIPLLGAHNIENVCAAITCAWQVVQDPAAIREATRNTTALPFRIEERRTVNGVTYYNDSFATNPDATIAAIKAVDQPKVLLLGGYDRGLDFTELASCIASKTHHVKHVVLYGATKQRLADALTQAHYSAITVLDAVENMSKVIETANSVVSQGDAVVLSPASASFDMFKNFEVRGQAFNQAVESL